MNNALKKTKIVCTIGPSSEAEPILREMIQSGMNIARLNFSHGSYDDHALIMGRVRKIAADLAVPVAIMQDLQGPKVRVGLLEKPFSVVAGQEIILGKDVSIDFDIFDTVRVGERILIEDGRIELKVASKSDIKPGEVGARLITCTTVTGGSIQSHKGVNIPDSTILFPVITEKDIADLHFGLDNDIDAVAVSFVRNKADILEIKKIIAGHAAAPLVIAKIEKKEAIANIDEIIEVSDGIMVARGDLGVEMPEEEVAILQKKIVELCRRAGKPVIVATQMLESMLSNPKPTRAEVSDVSNAVIDGTDCVMLSEETASGQYPVEAVKEMAAIIAAVETSAFALHISDELSDIEFGKNRTTSDSINSTSSTVMSTMSVPKPPLEITTFTEATKISRERPHAQINIATRNLKLRNQLSFVWGA